MLADVSAVGIKSTTSVSAAFVVQDGLSGTVIVLTRVRSAIAR